MKTVVVNNIIGKSNMLKKLELIACAGILFYAIILLTYTLERM